MVSKRHAKANNPLVDPEKPSSHILYLDASYLYGWAMSQPLPTGAFRWEEDCEQLAKTIADHPADDPEGFSFSSSPPVIFIAGRPKAALLFWFFGDFRCGALLFMVIHVIYKYKNT